MEDYELLRCLHENVTIGQRVYSVRFTSRLGSFIVKEYHCIRYREADSLLKAALMLIREPRLGTLVDVRMASVPNSSDFTVNFIMKKAEIADNFNVITRNEREMTSAFTANDYQLTSQICKKQAEVNVKIHKGVSQSLGCPVIIKTYKPLLSAEKANHAIREAFVQTLVQHECNCKLLDIVVEEFSHGRCGFKIRLIMEKLARDVCTEITKRSSYKTEFSESELLRFLKQVSTGLKHAKDKVKAKQGIAHRDIKPSNVFVTENGNYKMGDFGSTWEILMHTLTQSGAGTLVYTSPEMRISMQGAKIPLNSFASDIYSLGVTLLHMAKLEFPTIITLSDPHVLAESIWNEVESLTFTPQFKQLLISMLNIEPKSRPALEKVISTVDELEKAQLGQSKTDCQRRADPSQKPSEKVVPVLDSATSVIFLKDAPVIAAVPPIEPVFEVESITNDVSPRISQLQSARRTQKPSESTANITQSQNVTSSIHIIQLKVEAKSSLSPRLWGLDAHEERSGNYSPIIYQHEDSEEPDNRVKMVKIKPMEILEDKKHVSQMRFAPPAGKTTCCIIQ